MDAENLLPKEVRDKLHPMIHIVPESISNLVVKYEPERTERWWFFFNTTIPEMIELDVLKLRELVQLQRSVFNAYATAGVVKAACIMLVHTERYPEHVANHISSELIRAGASQSHVFKIRKACLNPQGCYLLDPWTCSCDYDVETKELITKLSVGAR